MEKKNADRIAKALERIADALEYMQSEGIDINSEINKAVAEGNDGDFALKVYRVGAADRE